MVSMVKISLVSLEISCGLEGPWESGGERKGVANIKVLQPSKVSSPGPILYRSSGCIYTGPSLDGGGYHLMLVNSSRQTATFRVNLCWTPVV